MTVDRRSEFSRRLVDLYPGQSAEVTAIEAGAPADHRRLYALGLVPGAQVTLIQRFPTYVLRVGHTTVAVDATMAAGVLVAAAPRKQGI